MKLYNCLGEIQRGDSPMSRDVWEWEPATIEQHQSRLNEAAGPNGWGRHGYRVNYAVAIGVDDHDERIDMMPSAAPELRAEPDMEQARRERKGGA